MAWDEAQYCIGFEPLWEITKYPCSRYFAKLAFVASSWMDVGEMFCLVGLVGWDRHRYIYTLAIPKSPLDVRQSPFRSRAEPKYPGFQNARLLTSSRLKSFACLRYGFSELLEYSSCAVRPTDYLSSRLIGWKYSLFLDLSSVQKSLRLVSSFLPFSFSIGLSTHFASALPRCRLNICTLSLHSRPSMVNHFYG